MKLTLCIHRRRFGGQNKILRSQCWHSTKLPFGFRSKCADQVMGIADTGHLLRYTTINVFKKQNRLVGEWFKAMQMLYDERVGNFLIERQFELGVDSEFGAFRTVCSSKRSAVYLGRIARLLHDEFGVDVNCRSLWHRTQNLSVEQQHSTISHNQVFH